MLGRAACALDKATRVVVGIDSVKELGTRARTSAGRAWRGTSALHRDAARGRARAGASTDAAQGSVIINGALFHSDDERVAALAQLEVDFTALVADIHRAAQDPQLKAQPDRARAVAAWLETDVLPAMAEWETFRRHEVESWVNRFATDWDVFESWLAKIIRLRELARVQGVRLTSGEPKPLPKTMFEQGTHGGGTAGGAFWTAIKTVIYGVVGIVGVVGLYGVAKDLKHKLAPAKNQENHHENHEQEESSPART